MNISLKVRSTSKEWELKNSVTGLDLESSLYDSPTSLTFDVLGVGELFPNGSSVELLIDDKQVFKGRIFSCETNETNTISVTAYDQLRYLKNEDTIYYSGKTASQILEDICNKNNLKYNIVNPSKWIVLEYLHDKSSMFKIMKHSLNETFTMEQKLYIIRDNFGVIEFVDVKNLKTNLLIGDKSLMTSFNYGLSIDEDTYNYVKITQDNKETKKRDMWVEEDSESINKWGKLQLTQSVDEHANEEQIKALARNILAVKNRETRTISIDAIGFYNLRAGDGIKVKIGNFIDEWFILSKVSTSIENNNATMSLEVFQSFDD